MYAMGGPTLSVSKDVEAILIPDGIKTTVPKDSEVTIQQILGGMFTVQTEEGYLVRIDGKDAEAIGQPVPKERRAILSEEVSDDTIDKLVWEQLRTCYDPEIPVNIVELGLIYQCDIHREPQGGYAVRIEMTLTAPGCGMGDVLKTDIETKLFGIPSMKEVVVDLIFDPAWDSSMMTEAARLQLGLM